MKFFWIFLAVFSFSITELSCFDIELLSFEKLPELDPEFADFGTLRLRKAGPNQFVVDGDFEFKQTFADEIEAVFEVFNVADRKKVFFVKGTMCKFMQTDRIFWPEVMKVSNLTDKCPLVKSPYYIRGYEIDPNSVPPHLQTGQYVIEGTFSETGTLKAGFRIKFNFDRLAV